MDKSTGAWINGFVGMLIFSGSLPATRIALGCFDPIFLTVTRATLAGCIGLALLLALRQRRPDGSDLSALAVVAFGVVIGFPLLSALALRYISSAHSLVLTALLPLATAIFGVLRAAERPRPAFWLCAGLGTAIVSSFALARSAEVAGPGDLLMLAAIILAGLGYAEGAKLTRRLGGWQVICWALVAALPLMAPLAVTTAPASFAAVSSPAWGGLAYVSLFSMLIGFVFWYRGLAQGGIATVGQLQLLQPFFGLMLAASFLHETVSDSMYAVCLAAAACVAGAKWCAR